MAKMKKLQPEMEKIRERFKDDRVRQQQELMALYKNEKINPMAGCLPIVLQIPVFFALYKVLFVTIDMRQAPFFGWIKDLSAPDPTSLFNLFGLLPFAVPEFLHVGVWPLIMGMTMWVQMQLNPQQPDPMQQKIFNWMPVMFTFLLASFPAGLVIYWAWNNVLSLLQQYCDHAQERHRGASVEEPRRRQVEGPAGGGEERRRQRAEEQGRRRVGGRRAVAPRDAEASARPSRPPRQARGRAQAGGRQRRGTARRAASRRAGPAVAADDARAGPEGAGPGVRRHRVRDQDGAAGTARRPASTARTTPSPRGSTRRARSCAARRPSWLAWAQGGTT